jgi:hypothetical protein
MRIDYVKRAYDDIIGARIRKGAKNKARVGVQLRNELLDFVDEQVPDFKAARGVWAGAEQLKGAAAFGREIFTEDADELAEIVARYGESERQAFHYGVAQAIRDKLEGATLTSDAARRLAGSVKNKRLLRAAFGDEEKFNAFLRQLDAEGAFTQSNYEILGNSKTAERLARRAERTGDVPDQSHSGLLNWLWRNLGPKDPLENESVNRMVSEILTGRLPPTGTPRVGLLGSPSAPAQARPPGLLMPPR